MTLPWKVKKSIFVELRVEWEENRSLENIRVETIFQAEGTASANVLGVGEEAGALREMKAELAKHKMREG